MSYYSNDGLLVYLNHAEASFCIKELKDKHGFHYGKGYCGIGL